MARLFTRDVCEKMSDETLRHVAGIRQSDSRVWYDLARMAEGNDADADYRECLATLAYRRISADSDPIDAEA